MDRQYENDRDLGISVIDTYTHYVLEYLEQINKTSQLTMLDLVSLELSTSLRLGTIDPIGIGLQFDTYEPEKMRSTPGVRSDLFSRPLDKALLTDFFGGVSQVEVVGEEAIESHMMSTPAENLPRSSPGENKPKNMKPFAVKLKEPPSESDGVFSATIRAWAGAALIGLFVWWTTVNASRSS